MAIKLKPEHKRVMKLIARDCDSEGRAKVSEQLYPVLSSSVPQELVEFEKLDIGGRARLTMEGHSVMGAMAWL
jgi:hypothetical protein